MGKHTRFEADEDNGKNSKATTTVRPTSTNSDKKIDVGRYIQKRTRRRPSGRPASMSPAARIRALDRMLKHCRATLPPTVQAEKEAELNSLRRLHAEHGRRENERRIAKKYHMVRFFERVKLDRRLRAIDRRIAKKDENEQKTAELKNNREQIRRDLLYVSRFPKDRKYVALFPTGGHDDRTKALVDEIRVQIEATAKGQHINQKFVSPEESTIAPEKKDREHSRRTTPSEQSNTKNEADVDIEKDDFFIEVEGSEPKNEQDVLMEKKEQEERRISNDADVRRRSRCKRRKEKDES